MVALNINGHDHSVDVPNDTPLLWVIREHLQMTGNQLGAGSAAGELRTGLILSVKAVWKAGPPPGMAAPR